MQRHNFEAGFISLGIRVCRIYFLHPVNLSCSFPFSRDIRGILMSSHQLSHLPKMMWNVPRGIRTTDVEAPCVFSDAPNRDLEISHSHWRL